MPTDNRRVAAYLPKHINDRLEAFKTDRELKGDSPALIAILEEYFGVSREVAHSSSLQLDTEVLKRELLSELKHELLRLKSEIKRELLSELESELLETDMVEVDHPEQLSTPSTQEVDQQTSDSSSSSELPEQATDLKEDELPSESDSKLLDESTALSGVKLSKRLGVGAPRLAAMQHATSQEFAEWSRKKDPEGLAWRRVKKGKYFPILNS